MFKSFFKRKIVSNSLWIICEKVIQMIVSFFVGVLSARFLGPNNYGLINYGGAYVAFFSSVCTLGINSVITKNFSDYPNEEGTTIGTAIILRVVSSFLSVAMILGIVSILDAKSFVTIIVVFLCSVSLFFQVFNTFNYWFIYKYKSKVIAISTFVAYMIVSIYRVILLIWRVNVYWFVLASTLDYLILAISLIIVYIKHKGPKCYFSFAKAKQLLSVSYHYILSGMMAAIYAQTDKIMLNHMMSEAEVGFYSIATNLAVIWTFVLQAVIDAFNPTIISLYKTDKRAFEKKNIQLYRFVIYSSLFVSLLFVLFGEVAIDVLYGKEYASSTAPLKIITWYTCFSYLGVARGAWVLCTKNQKYLKWMYVTAAIVNVCLNFILIPFSGAVGAALASVITQMLTSFIIPCLIKNMRPNVKLFVKALFFLNS